MNCTTLFLASILASLLVCNRACGVWLPLSQSHNLSNTFSQSNPLRTPSQLHRLPYWFPLPTKCLPDPFSLNPGAIYVSQCSFFLSFFLCFLCFLSWIFCLPSFLLSFLLAHFLSFSLNVFPPSPGSLLGCDLHLTFLCLLPPACSFSNTNLCAALPGCLAQYGACVISSRVLLEQIPQGLNRPCYLLSPLLCAMCT